MARRPAHSSHSKGRGGPPRREPKPGTPTRTSSRSPARHAESRPNHRGAAEPERLQKVLARAGLASRREAEDWIRAGRITVNGEPATLGVRITPSDHVRLDGRLIRQRESGGAARVFVCHRSPGESLDQPAAEGADSAAESSTSLIDRLPSRAGRRFIAISPMPRIDGGLELVTSDGELAAQLQRAVRGFTSEFSVRVLGELSPQQLEGILGGVLDSGERIEVTRCEPSGGEGANRWYAFVARGASGKDVRQLFERQGALISRVQRTHFGPVAMERALSRGKFRELTADELQALTAAVATGS